MSPAPTLRITSSSTTTTRVFHCSTPFAQRKTVRSRHIFRLVIASIMRSRAFLPPPAAPRKHAAATLLPTPFTQQAAAKAPPPPRLPHLLLHSFLLRRSTSSRQRIRIYPCQPRHCCRRSGTPLGQPHPRHFTLTTKQRCHVHAQSNIHAYIPILASA